MKTGYARVSTLAQNLDRQIAALKAEGCDLIYPEKASGKDVRNHLQLARAIVALQEDDVFIVAEWDRTTRSFTDGVNIKAEVGQRKATMKVLDRPLLDLTEPLSLVESKGLDSVSNNNEKVRWTLCQN